MGLGLIAMYYTKQPIIAAVMLWAGIGIIYAQPSWNSIASTVAVTSASSVIVALWVVLASPKIA